MALTEFQRSVCRAIAQSRITSGESYVAGGAALNESLGAPRVSRDVDLFHDTDAALDSSWQSDRQLLEGGGFTVRAVRERASFVEAEISRGQDAVLLQWMRDSAYRFFPLVEHELFGLALHPFDLATNKVLALVGRLEVRDWVDVIECDERLQPLGYLAWAACGKDPGFSPRAILEYAGRSSHYSAEEVSMLAFAGSTPDVAELSRRWRAILATAREVVDALPIEQVGKCVLGSDGALFRGGVEALRDGLRQGAVRFHAGHLGGVLPRIVGS
jgi:hypothetical protein